ncbi:restriction endonuclease subunit S [Rothia nasimurium]|uniref:restriction endonuclease subunit S n=1 Tax=Rothia nasimurium TaxID=85336 RepID=UPI001F01B0A0|nr:restriction endonuclease subunit S [Rothia nasimurium]
MGRSLPLWPFLQEVDKRAGKLAESLPLLSVSQTRGVVRFSEIFDKEPRAEDLSNYKLVEPEDLVINRMSADKGALGIASERGVASPDYMVLRSKGEVSPKYIAYLLKSDFGLSEIKKILRGIGTGDTNTVRTPRISRHELLHIKWPNIPNLEDQKRIADELDRELAEIDEFIADQQRLQDLLQERLVSLTFVLATDASNPDRYETGHPFWKTLPKGWTLQKLGWHFKIGNGSTPSTENPDYWTDEDNGFPWFNSSVVNSEIAVEPARFVTKQAIRECHLPIVPRDSLLLGLTGQGKTRGMVTKTGIDATINQHMAYLIPRKNSPLTVDYAMLALKAAYPELRFLSDGNGGTKGALSCDMLQNFQVPTPSSIMQAHLRSLYKNQLANNLLLISQINEINALQSERKQSLVINKIILDRDSK